MPELFRVFPWLSTARDDEPGGALYIPQPGGGRIDYPGSYSVLYLSDTAAGAVAEAFGRFPEWTPAILEGSPGLPGSVRGIARYRLADDAAVCNLDSPEQLLELGLRPSDVVSRDYDRTREWARRIYRQTRWVGVRWWSYYDPAWASYGLWDTRKMGLEEVKPLHLGDAAFREAGRVIVRCIVPNRA